MPDLTEESTSAAGNVTHGPVELPTDIEAQSSSPPAASGWRTLRRARTNIGKAEEKEREEQRATDEEEYEEGLVDILDLVGMRVLVFD